MGKFWFILKFSSSNFNFSELGSVNKEMFNIERECMVVWSDSTPLQ